MQDLIIDKSIQKNENSFIFRRNFTCKIPEFEYKELGSVREIRPWAQKHFGEWKKSLSWDEIEAIGHYTTSGYRSVNKALRNGKPLKGAEAKRYETLCNAIESARIPENILVYRKASHHILGDLINVSPEKWIGKTVSDKGFLSTTLQKYKAQAFTNDPCEFPCGCSPLRFIRKLTVDRHLPKYLRNGMVMTIKVPEGTTGTYIGSLSATSSIYGIGTEEEILLGKNQTLKINKVDLYRNFVELECEVVRGSEKKH